MILKPISSRRWNHIDNEDLGLMNILSESIYRVETNFPSLLPELRFCPTIFIGSDYSGQHNTAKYEALSFLFADLQGCASWDYHRKIVRNRYLKDGRRMSYKQLNDRQRNRALFPFLNAANYIPGLLLTLLIEKEVGYLCIPSNGSLKDHEILKDYAHWNKVSFEKMLRVLHFASLFIAGLSRSKQNIIWITDEDDIVPNDQRLKEVIEIFAAISSHYIQHDMGHFRFGTTKSDKLDRQLEDLIAIPDFAAGSLCRVFREHRDQRTIPTSAVIVPPPENLPQKARNIMSWFSDNSHPLKRLVYMIRTMNDTTDLTVQYFRFHGTNDFV